MDLLPIFTPVTVPLKSVTLRHQLDDDGVPWFVAKDICDYLEISNVSQACSRLFDGYSRISGVDTEIGIQRDMNLVNDLGLYQLIFQSRKPEAEEFQKAVYEMLRQLYRHGYYRLPGRALPGAGRQGGYGRQPFLDELKQRGISQRVAREAMNQLDLPVAQVPDSKYGNAIYGGCRPSQALVTRASAYLNMPVERLFTAPVRD